MNWELKVDDFAKKQLSRIPKKDVERIVLILRELAVDPYSGDIQKMRGEKDVWRRRIGSYRIFYEVYQKERAVYINEIKRRTSKTY